MRPVRVAKILSQGEIDCLTHLIRQRDIFHGPPDRIGLLGANALPPDQVMQSHEAGKDEGNFCEPIRSVSAVID